MMSVPVESHERNCFHNPGRRACQTCHYYRHHNGIPGSTDYEEEVRVCMVEHWDLNTGLVADCPKWTPRRPNYNKGNVDE